MAGNKKQRAPKKVNFKAIEKKWQKAWGQIDAFQVKEESDKKKKYYVCEMFPYPSADYLHMGHLRNFAIGDLIARYKRMRGFNVLYPMGFDAFGLPAENAAIKKGVHPKKYALHSIAMIRKMMKEIGLSYDWSREIRTCDSDYYKWNQWLFLRMLEKGIAYRKKAPVNWCPSCKTVLANEEALGGKCWRCDSTVTVTHLEQWFLKITAYADELLKGLEGLAWPERVKELQRHWIGRSEGTHVTFPVEGSDKMIEVFTTRADTLYGVTFLACAVQHELVAELVKNTKHEKEYQEFLSKMTASEKLEVEKEKEGFFTGRYAVHPLTGEKIPIYAGNFVVADYGTGAVMGVPAHDQRDFEFAKKHKIDIKQVIAPLFVTNEGKDAVQKDKLEVMRDSVFAIVKHWKEDKYFCLDWKKFEWKSLIIGGVDEGESSEDAAIREVKEETGYQDIKSVSPVGFENHGNYYAEHKGVNRYAKFRTFLVKLGSGKYVEPDKEQVKNHEGVWVDREQVGNFLNLLNNKYVWDIYTNGERAYVEDGVLINSDAFNGLDSNTARSRISELLAKKGAGGHAVEHKLRDWLISRQRYWGTPIPIVYCSSCGVVPVPDKDLPIVLPEKVKFTGKGNPLQTNENFVKTKCPCCDGEARRETDTMATFFDSSWYYLRYCSPKSHDIFDRKSVEYWMPVDQYIGGIEHAVLHLLYARFFIKFLRDLGWVTFDEPFTKLFNQGILHKDGKRMSKSHGNTITVREASQMYGVDTARLFLLFVSSPDKDTEWGEHGIEGMARTVRTFMGLFDKVGGAADVLMEHKLNKTLSIVEQSYEKFEFNKGMVAFVEFVNFLADKEQVPRHVLETIALMISPVMPHLAEELWNRLGRANLVVQEGWPKVREDAIHDELEIAEKQVEKTVSDIVNVIGLIKDKKGEVEKVYLYVLPKEVVHYNGTILSKRIGKKVAVFAVNDTNIYDPQGRSKKVKPGRPSIYVE